MTTGTTLGRRTALAAVYIERYVISVVFFYLAYTGVQKLMALRDPGHIAPGSSLVIQVIEQLIWIQLYLYSGLLLLVGRRVAALPKGLLDILLPLGTTFFFIAYAVVPRLPLALQRNLWPPEWRGGCVAAGLVLNLIGLWIAIWAAVYLGRSFGVLVEVRKVVLAGPYQWVRHPMYSGYICFMLGAAVAIPSPAFLTLIPLHAALLMYRARLEEKRLSECSEEYQNYRKRTGFIFPKLRRND